MDNLELYSTEDVLELLARLRVALPSLISSTNQYSQYLEKLLPGAVDYSKEHVQTSRVNKIENKLLDLIEQMKEREEHIAECLDAYNLLWLEVDKAITNYSAVSEDSQTGPLLRDKYLNGLPDKALQEKYGLGRTSVWRKLGKAREELVLPTLDWVDWISKLNVL